MIPSLQSLYVIYGMTEIGLISVNADWTLSKALDEFPAFSCGRLAPGNELIVKDMDTGNSLGAREIGEFYFRSPYSCKGYFKQSKVCDKKYVHMLTLFKQFFVDYTRNVSK
jgi:long-subunit acyl-CoA synthetase (AMP-forming)